MRLSRRLWQIFLKLLYFLLIVLLASFAAGAGYIRKHTTYVYCQIRLASTHEVDNFYDTVVVTGMSATYSWAK
jgi:hypothetical protein